MPRHTPTLIPHKEWVCPYSGRKQGTTDLLLPSAASSGAPIRPCLISCWSLNKLYWLEKAKNPTRYQIHGSQGGAAVPFWGEDLATKRSFLGADKRPCEPLISVSLLSVSQPSRPLGVSGPHSRNAFPSPLSFSRSWNLSTSRLSSSPLAFPDSGCGAATASLLAASVTCSLWPPTAHLNRRQTGVGEARLMPCRPWCSRLPEGRFMRVIQV